MKQQVLLVLIVAGIAGATSSVITTALVAPDGSVQEAAVSPVEEPTAALRERVVSLEAQNRDLLDRLVALELRPLPEVSERAPAAVDSGIEDAVAVELRALLASMRDSTGQLPPDLRTGVSDALQTIREEEERERERQREKAESERLDERLVELTEKLSLNQYQTGELRTILTDSNRKRGETFQKLRESGDWRNMGEPMRQLRDETNLALSNVLDPTQYDQYQELEGRRYRGMGGMMRGMGGSREGDGDG